MFQLHTAAKTQFTTLSQLANKQPPETRLFRREEFVHGDFIQTTHNHNVGGLQFVMAARRVLLSQIFPALQAGHN